MTDSSSDANQKTRDSIFDHLVPDRECGECVACCKILEIRAPELQKSADTLCQYCTGVGCGIYENRPEVCRTWYCLWRRIPSMPDDLRPDKCGVVFSLDAHNPPRILFESIYIVARAVDDSDALAKPAAASAVAMFIEQGALPVWISFKGQKKMIYPDQQLADAILQPTQTIWQSLVPRAIAWREQYGQG